MPASNMAPRRRAGDIVDVAGLVGRYPAQILAVERAGMPVGPTSQRDESDDEECATGSPRGARRTAVAVAGSTLFMVGCCWSFPGRACC
jgi:hypothetical protein